MDSGTGLSNLRLAFFVSARAEMPVAWLTQAEMARKALA